jgi:hypothetical protein
LILTLFSQKNYVNALFHDCNDPCNFYADLSKITATAVFLYVITSVPYSESNEPKHFIFQNIFMQMLYFMIFMIDPCNSNADLSKLTATGVFFYVFPSVPYSELNKE